MIFGRSNQQQAQNQPNPQAAAGYGAPGNEGFVPGTGAQPVSAWTGAGYPTQPSGTGYAGYTPGAGQQPAGTGYTGGYGAQAQQGFGQGAGYNPWPQAGQGAAPQSYGQMSPSQGQPYAAMGQGYAQAGQTGQGYAQPSQGYAPPQGGYAYPQMNPQGYGTQGQAGYAQGQAGYAQGGYNNAYAQMGRNQMPQQPQPQDFSRQIPLNGGGYVPPAVPVRKQPFVFQSWMLILLGAVLAALFAVGTFVPSAKALLWVFIALSVASIAFFWVKPLVTGNRRLCYTIIFGVLTMVALLSVLGLLTPADTTRDPAGTENVQPAGSTSVSSASVVDSQTGTAISAVTEPQITATPTPMVDDTATTDRLEAFFRYWSANRQDEMLTLCSPSWQSSVDNPKTALFGLMANRTPLDYTLEKISGTPDDSSRTVTVVSTMDRNNGKDPVKYRLNVLMTREGDLWYVDPQSLKTYEAADTPDPSITDTPAPTEEPLVSSSTILYYNPDGGSKYHLDPNCPSIHAKYLPLKGHFTYAEVNDANYKDLSPCNVCAAPLRP